MRPRSKRKDQVVKRLVRGVAASMKANGVCVFQAVGTLCGKADTGEFLVSAGNDSLTASRIILATAPTQSCRRFPVCAKD